MLKELNEKVVIVTGAGQGIGKGIALCLAKRGVKIVCVGRRLEPIVETAEEIKSLGSEAIAISCDVAEREQVKEVVRKTVERFGTVDVVINNAQPIPSPATVEDTTYENMLFAWKGGTIGSLNFMQECFPYMKEQGEGRVINFASATGMFGYAGQLAYASNKEAVRGLTKIASKEWGKYNITVNCVLPGAESPAAEEWAKKYPEKYAEAIEAQPMKRLGDPEDDIGRVVAFLAGPDSKYLSGQSILVDGGFSIMP
jgi:NAD(P)-dependent dehydrogenase (short-subunit alcohol dehydrogenase family)